jgi:tetratricopeptide (TPR) repeat protein
MNKTTSPILALHEISLYNTGRISPEKIIAAFAARVEQFQRIVADLVAEKPKSRAQHHLIVGQRGMGKTMLLARIAAELRTKPDLAQRFIPLVFAEEQYAVDRLSKFWLNCLDSLADAREAAKDTKAVEEIDATVSRLQAASVRAVKDDQPFADEVYEAFIKAAQVTGQRPVLLVDNLQLVFERLDKGQQHSLRELLMRQASPILVGASPSPPPQSQDYGAAFYDQFKVHYLRPLDESEMRDLLLHLADAAQRDDVRQRVLQHPARLKVLRQLTGGNPRTTLTLFFLYAEDFAPSVFGDLEGLLDRVTPLYKARFEELTAQQQVITSAIANHWDPVTAAKLAATTGLPAGTISAQLDRLEKTGVIERTELFGETRTGYLLAERFFNIWFLMRSASRRQRREVEFLTRFLENFYEPTDRCRIAQHLMGEDRFSPDRYLWSRAVADSLKHEPQTAEELNRHTELMALREEAREARARLHELIDFSSLPQATLAFDDLWKKLMSLVPASAEISPQDFAKAVLGDRAMFMSGERQQLAARHGQLSDAELKSILDSIAKSREADVESYDEDAVSWFSQRLASGQIRSHQDIQDWNRAFLQTDESNRFSLMTDSLPDDFGSKLSEETVNRIVSILKPKNLAEANKWVCWGLILHMKLVRPIEAEFAYKEAIKRLPDEIVKNRLEQSEVRIESQQTTTSEIKKKLNTLAELHQKVHDSLVHMLSATWTMFGTLIESKISRHAEAETAYRQAISINPKDAWPWIGLGKIYSDQLDRPEDALSAFEEALRINPASDTAHQGRLFLRRDYMGNGAAERALLAELMALPKQEFPDTTKLHEALFAAYDSNWGLACEALAQAIEIRKEGFSPYNTDDWLRASAVLIHLNYGAELLTFLDQLGDTTARLRPWVEALRALQIGSRQALQNIAPEIRTTAEIFYDGIERRLLKLPEKTRRRPIAKAKAKRSPRSGGV